jgi:GTP-binding protein
MLATNTESFRKLSFYTSAMSWTNVEQVPSIAEVAFVGRSNAGKSSALNAIAGQTQLARVSKTPGRTQCINFFQLIPQYYLVDLPGYGYAKVAMQLKQQWQGLLDTYLEQRTTLKGLVLLTDIKLPLQPLDLQLIHWCQSCQLPMNILLTKADKLSNSAAKSRFLQQNSQLKALALPAPELCIVSLFSATKRLGVTTLQQQILSWLNLSAPAPLADHSD